MVMALMVEPTKNKKAQQITCNKCNTLTSYPLAYICPTNIAAQCSMCSITLLPAQKLLKYVALNVIIREGWRDVLERNKNESMKTGRVSEKDRKQVSGIIERWYTFQNACNEGKLDEHRT